MSPLCSLNLKELCIAEGSGTMDRKQGSLAGGVGQLSYLRHGWNGYHHGGPFVYDHMGIGPVGRPPGSGQRGGQCPHRITTVLQTTTHRVASILPRVVAVRFAAAGEPLEGRKATRKIFKNKFENT